MTRPQPDGMKLLRFVCDLPDYADNKKLNHCDRAGGSLTLPYILLFESPQFPKKSLLMIDI